MFKFINRFKKAPKKNFLLCVGCQKGGTTWLARQLRLHRNVDLGFKKEYHIFDALYVDECRDFYIDKIEELMASDFMIKQSDTHLNNLLTHVSFYLDPEKYFDYFDYLHYRSKGQVELVGDISPSYCALPVKALTHIKKGLECRGFKVKVLFILRDPLDRCWSAVRMSHRRARKNNKDVFIQDENIAVKERYSDSEFVLRTTYENTITNLESVFSSRDIYYGIFETFFEKESVNRLVNFLELPDFSPDSNKKINVSPRRLQALSDDVSREVVEFYRKTYEFCDQKFDLRTLWGGFRFL